MIALGLVLSCGGGPGGMPAPEPTPSPTGSTGEAATGTTADTAGECACDDGLDCTDDACDALGRCTSVPLYDCAWPASTIEEALPIAAIHPQLEVSMSGASWNTSTRRLWVLRNSGPEGIWRLAQDGRGSWEIEAAWVGLGLGDIEGITQVDPAGRPHEVTLIDEEVAHIVSYDLSVGGVATEIGRWDVSAWCPPGGALGAEAIVFVPDEALLDWGFTDASGMPRTSTLGMGGLVLVGWQRGGQVFAFDLSPSDGTVAWAGTYDTARGETSGLELDADTGRLYLWHGVANDLEVARLSSVAVGLANRKLETEALFDFPGKGNLEGVAISGTADCSKEGRPLFLIVDGGSVQSISLFDDWPVGCP